MLWKRDRVPEVGAGKQGDLKGEGRSSQLLARRRREAAHASWRTLSVMLRALSVASMSSEPEVEGAAKEEEEERSVRPCYAGCRGYRGQLAARMAGKMGGRSRLGDGDAASPDLPPFEGGAQPRSSS
jgi:hypothetical protein